MVRINIEFENYSIFVQTKDLDVNNTYELCVAIYDSKYLEANNLTHDI